MISVGACGLDQVKVHVMRSCSVVELSVVGSEEGPNKTTWTTGTLEVFSWQCFSTARKQHRVSYPEKKSNDVASLPWKELMAWVFAEYLLCAGREGGGCDKDINRALLKPWRVSQIP